MTPLERTALFEQLDEVVSPEALAENPFLVAELAGFLRTWQSRHAAAARAIRLKQREPDPRGGPPEGGTPGAARGAELAA